MCSEGCRWEKLSVKAFFWLSNIDPNHGVFQNTSFCFVVEVFVLPKRHQHVTKTMKYLLKKWRTKASIRVEVDTPTWFMMLLSERLTSPICVLTEVHQWWIELANTIVWMSWTMSIIVWRDAIDCVLITCRAMLILTLKGAVFCLFVLPAGLSHYHLPRDRQTVRQTGEAYIYKYIHRIK